MNDDSASIYEYSHIRRNIIACIALDEHVNVDTEN